MLREQITIVGRVGTDPELRTTPWNEPEASFRVASTSRVRDQRTGEWRDGTTSWFTVRTRRRLAEHTRDCLRTGQSVVVVGRLSVRTWEAKDGGKGTSVEIEADALGPDLGAHRARIEPAERGAASGRGATPAGTPDGPDTADPAAAEDWHRPPADAALAGAGTGDPEPPF